MIRPSQMMTPVQTKIEAKMKAVLCAIKPNTSKVVAITICSINPVMAVVAARWQALWSTLIYVC